MSAACVCQKHACTIEAKTVRKICVAVHGKLLHLAVCGALDGQLTARRRHKKKKIDQHDTMSALLLLGHRNKVAYPHNCAAAFLFSMLAWNDL